MKVDYLQMKMAVPEISFHYFQEEVHFQTTLDSGFDTERKIHTCLLRVTEITSAFSSALKHNKYATSTQHSLIRR